MNNNHYKYIYLIITVIIYCKIFGNYTLRKQSALIMQKSFCRLTQKLSVLQHNLKYIFSQKIRLFQTKPSGRDQKSSISSVISLYMILQQMHVVIICVHSAKYRLVETETSSKSKKKYKFCMYFADQADTFSIYFSIKVQIWGRRNNVFAIVRRQSDTYM